MSIVPGVPTIDASLMAASAGIILLLGSAHLLLTFVGGKLHPRDGALEARMREVPLVLTDETTMWRAWVGFNASHSVGAILFGVVYGDLAVAHHALLFASPLLLGTGLAVLIGYMLLAWRCWFSAPLRGIGLATALYVAALVVGVT